MIVRPSSDRPGRRGFWQSNSASWPSRPFVHPFLVFLAPETFRDAEAVPFFAVFLAAFFAPLALRFVELILFFAVFFAPFAARFAEAVVFFVAFVAPTSSRLTGVLFALPALLT